jgi:multidrug efflux system membrane fusion protein
MDWVNKKQLKVAGVIVIVGVAVCLMAVTGGIKRARTAKRIAEKEAQAHAPRAVTIEKVRADVNPSARSYPGIVRASEEAALSFRVGGPLVSVNVVLGEPVKKGTLLMQIDPRDFEDQVAALEAQLAGAQAVLKNARQEFERAEPLFAAKVIPQADMDRATRGLDSADAAAKTVAAQLNIARHQLLDTELRAPYDGRVTAQLAENQEMVKSAAVVLRFQNIQALEVTAHIPENEIIRRNLQVGAAAQVRFPAASETVCEASLTEWSSEADARTRTYAVTFQFNAPQAVHILPGMTANVSWPEDTTTATLYSVPVSAFVPAGDGGSRVWVYDPATKLAAARPVQLGGLIGSERRVVASGLSAGEWVVVAGSRLIYENQPLEAVPVQ